jgi:hypothetical protein
VNLGLELGPDPDQTRSHADQATRLAHLGRSDPTSGKRLVRSR